MTANQTLDLTVASPEIGAGRTYRGIVQSTPFEVGPATATTAGSITFTGVVLPADWSAGDHTVTLIDVSSGATTSVVAFTVDADGSVTAASPGSGTTGAVTTSTPTSGTGGTPTPTPAPTRGGSLPATGGDSTPIVPLALLLLLVGVAFAAAARRRVPAVD